jgi:hypothetical protein
MIDLFIFNNNYICEVSEMKYQKWIDGGRIFLSILLLMHHRNGTLTILN